MYSTQLTDNHKVSNLRKILKTLPIIVITAILLNSGAILESLFSAGIQDDEATKYGLTGASIIGSIGILFSFFNGLILGSVVYLKSLTTQAESEGDSKKVSDVTRFKLALIILLSALFIGIVLILRSWYFDNIVKVPHVAGAKEWLKSEGSSYLYKSFGYWALFAINATMLYSFIQIKQPLKALIITIIGVSVNSLMMFLTIRVFDMGTDGLILSLYVTKGVELLVIIIFAMRTDLRFNILKLFILPKAILVPWAKKWFYLLDAFMVPLGSFLINVSILRFEGSSQVISLINTVIMTAIMAPWQQGISQTTGLLIGRKLGKNKMDEAWSMYKTLLKFNIVANIIVGAVIIVPLSFFLPQMYIPENVQGLDRDELIKQTQQIMWFRAGLFAVWGIVSTSSTSMQSGGYVWGQLSTGFIAYYTFNVAPIFIFSLLNNNLEVFSYAYLAYIAGDILKSTIVLYFVSRKKWLSNVSNPKTAKHGIGDSRHPHILEQLHSKHVG